MKHINRKFRKQMYRDPFDFYYGPMANIIRTKYRPVDRPLTRQGVKLLRKKSGVHAIVHGHRNLLHGQRVMLRKGIVNFECDTTLDRNSRAKEGLEGIEFLSGKSFSRKNIYFAKNQPADYPVSDT